MPYSKISPEDLILRDHLARDRTMLANERTFLAYIRTAIMLEVAAVTLVKLFPNDATMMILGIALLPIGLLIFVIGYARFQYVRRRLALLQKQENGT